jgi:segregation and condensation protein A
MNITQLGTGYQDLLVRARKRTTVLKKETVSLADKIIEFSDRLKVGEMTELTRLLSENPERGEIVVTFLASLELSRLKKMRLHQDKAYSEIYVELVETLRNFNFDLASGFEAEIQTAAQGAAQERQDRRDGQERQIGEESRSIEGESAPLDVAGITAESGIDAAPAPGV